MRTNYKQFTASILITLMGFTVITSATFTAGVASDYVGVTEDSFFMYYISTKYATAPANDSTQFMLLVVDSIEDFSTSTNITYSFSILYGGDPVQPGPSHYTINHSIPNPINLDPDDAGDWLSLAILAYFIMIYRGGWILNKQLLPKELKLENATSGDLISIKYDDNGVLESLNLANPDSDDVTELQILRLNTYIYIGGGVLGVVLLLIIIACCSKRRR